MSEPEVQSLIPLICSGSKIFKSLALRHTSPLSLPSLVPPNIIDLRQSINPKISHADCNQCTIATLVARGVVGAIDVRSDDPAGLHEHVVQGSRDSAGTHCVGVAGVPGDLDWMCWVVLVEENTGKGG